MFHAAYNSLYAFWPVPLSYVYYEHVRFKSGLVCKTKIGHYINYSWMHEFHGSQKKRTKILNKHLLKSLKLYGVFIFTLHMYTFWANKYFRCWTHLLFRVSCVDFITVSNMAYLLCDFFYSIIMMFTRND